MLSATMVWADLDMIRVFVDIAAVVMAVGFFEHVCGLFCIITPFTGTTFSDGREGSNSTS